MPDKSNKYKKLNPIQSGSFSTVYKGYNTETDDFVALKVIPKSKFSQRGMANEYNVGKLLSKDEGCPFICSFVDFYEDETNYTLVQEYCECGDFYDFLELSKKKGDLNAPSIIKLNFQKVVLQLSYAIKYAHSMGIAHRDIKPENILINYHGDIKLADWGHAISASSSNDNNIGTDNYRGPETFSSKVSYNTYRSDYWSMGVTLLYLLFSHCPFRCSNIKNEKIVYKRLENGETLVYPNCHIFNNYVSDPYKFIYESFFSSVSLSRRRKLFKSSSTNYVAPFLWQDMTDMHDMLQMTKIIVDNLMSPNPSKRSLTRFLKHFNAFWTAHQENDIESASSVRNIKSNNLKVLGVSGNY